MVRKIRAKLVLQLRNQGLSGRAISLAQGMSRHSVQAVVDAADQLGLGWDDVAEKSEGEVPPCALYTRRKEPNPGWPPSTPLPAPKTATARSAHRPPNTPQMDPNSANIHLVHEPGFQVQCDLWFPHDPLPVGAGQNDTPPVLGDDLGVLGIHPGTDAALTDDAGPSGRNVDSAPGCAGGSVPAVVGQRVRHRQAPAHGAGGRVRRVPRAGDQAASAAGSGVQGHGRADEQVLPAALHAGQGFPLPSGFQRPAGGHEDHKDASQNPSTVLLSLQLSSVDGAASQ
jgi:hypothetical protein